MRLFPIGLLPLLLPLLALGASQSSSKSVQELKDFFSRLPKASKDSDWYGNPSADSGRCGIAIENRKDGSTEGGLNLFIGDINNDGLDEFVLVHRCGGSSRTDTILDVFQKDGESYKNLGFDSLLEKNGLDGSKLPMNIGTPMLSKEGGKVVVRFDSPRETWIWEKDKIGRLDTKQK